MTFYKVQQHYRNASSSPFWATKEENQYGETWRNIHGGWCLRYPEDDILAVDEAKDRKDFIDRNRKDIYSYLIKPDSDIGWLSPDGKFYGCDYANHDIFVNQYFGKTDMEMEKEGWIRIFRGFESKVPVYCKFKVSTPQRIWLEDHNVEFSNY